MQGICPVCEIRVEEIDGECTCKKCGARWKADIWRRKQSLFKKRPTWLARNAYKINALFLVSSVVLPTVAAVLLVTQTVMIGG